MADVANVVKARRAVGYTLNHLIGNDVLSRRLAYHLRVLDWKPEQKNLLVKRLITLSMGAIPVSRLVVPTGFSSSQVDELLINMKSFGYCLPIMNGKTLDLRQTGFVPASSDFQTINLFGDISQRTIVSRESEHCLTELAVLFPFQTRTFLSNLRGLGSKITGLIVPSNVVAPQNWAVVEQISSHDGLSRLIDESGRVDFRRAGLKEKMGDGIDHTPAFRRLSLADFNGIIQASSEHFIKNMEHANLFLFKAILRARIELYFAAEARSAKIEPGLQVAITPDLIAVSDFLENLRNQFPFNTSSIHLSFKQSLGTAIMLLQTRNEPAAEATLVRLTDLMSNALQQHLLGRLRQDHTDLDWKVGMDDSDHGEWTIMQTGYRRTESGLLLKERIENKVTNAKVLSMIQHELDSIAKERSLNDQYCETLGIIEQDVTLHYDKLLDLFDRFVNYVALQKDKAAIELEAAALLVGVGTDQSARLAKDMLSLASADLKLRNQELDGQTTSLTRVKVEIERLIGERLAVIEREVGRRIAASGLIDSPDLVGRLDHILGKLLGTFFKDEMREHWLGKAKSKIYGLKRALPEIRKMVEERQAIKSAIVEERRVFISMMEQARANNGLAQLQQAAMDRVEKMLSELAEVNGKLYIVLDKAAKHILTLRVAFLNRDQQTTTEIDHLAEYLDLFIQLQHSRDYVMALSSDKKRELGKVLRRDADQLKLSYESLAVL